VADCVIYSLPQILCKNVAICNSLFVTHVTDDIIQELMSPVADENHLIIYARQFSFFA